MKSVKLDGGKFRLAKEGDPKCGDSGPMLVSLKAIEKEDGLWELGQEGENGEIHLDCCIRCGSIYARSYQYQDWWQTSYVTEILEVADDNSWVRFKTRNSIYKAEVI